MLLVLLLLGALSFWAIYWAHISLFKLMAAIELRDLKTEYIMTKNLWMWVDIAMIFAAAFGSVLMWLIITKWGV